MQLVGWGLDIRNRAQELRQKFQVYGNRDAGEHELRQEFHVSVIGVYISLLNGVSRPPDLVTINIALLTED